jgi:hypothetical protein
MNLSDRKTTRPENIEKSVINNKAPFVRRPYSDRAKLMR